MGIRGQLTLLITGLVALAMTTTAVYAVRTERREAMADFRAQNEKMLQAVGVTAAIHVAQNDIGALDTLVAHLSDAYRSRDLLDLAVLDDQGRVLAHSQPERFNTVQDDGFTKEALEADGTVWDLEPTKLRMAVPAVSGIRWATVRATFSTARVERTLERLRTRWIGLLLGIFVLLAGAMYLALDRLVIRPVRSLQQVARRMGEGHLTARSELKRGELGELAQTMNGMAQALHHERENLERTVADRTRELSELNERLERLAVTDGLTGLYNHRRFHEALQTELLRAERHKRPLGVLMVDVDFFKRVNDSMGHPAGDELLRRLGEVLAADLRQTDLIARYGGEEFAVLLPESSKTEALQVAERMRAAVEDKINKGTPWVQRVTISVGVATYPEDGRTAEQVLSAADEALYVAKRKGRNRVVGSRGIAA